MIGGTNCESAMGVAAARAFPWVDYVVSGEADEIIVPLVPANCRARTWKSRRRGVIDLPNRPAPRYGTAACFGLVRLDAIPTPDYDDYSPPWSGRLCVRRSCRPCGGDVSRLLWAPVALHLLRAERRQHVLRAKSPARAVEEFHRLAARYGVRRFTVVDNIHRHAVITRAFCQAWKSRLRHLLRDQGQSAAPAICRVSPTPVSDRPAGHRELSRRDPRLLAKGNKAWMNVQLLKWASELSMEISWIF